MLHMSTPTTYLDVYFCGPSVTQALHTQVALIEHLGTEDDDDEEGGRGGDRDVWLPSTAPLVVPCMDPHITLYVLCCCMFKSIMCE